MVQIVDSTLREGRQTAPGINFSWEQSLKIAKLLHSLGIDIIEVCHPVVSIEQKQIVREIVASNLCPVIAHARANLADIEAVKETSAQWVGIFLGINEETRLTRARWTISKIFNCIKESVMYAKTLGLKVRYTAEDASRTDYCLLKSVYSVAIEAGADCICFSDTVGIMEPNEVTETIEKLKSDFSTVPLEVHFHNDRGLAMANALAASDAGAERISSSVNGLGERCGITDTLGLLVNLYYKGLRSLPSGEIIQRTSKYVAAFSRYPVNFNQPISGGNAFIHTAHLHQKAVKRDPSSYSWILPEYVGKTMELSGKSIPSVHSLFLTPIVKCASELGYHRYGDSVGHLMIDECMVPNCRQSCIVREIRVVEEKPLAYVDVQTLYVDSLFLFLGHELGMKGLQVEVCLGQVVQKIDSPASVFIPAGVAHTYRILNGSGFCINHVLSGSYNDSLLEPLDISNNSYS